MSPERWWQREDSKVDYVKKKNYVKAQRNTKKVPFLLQ
jgi:hypothetical protein